MEGLESVLHKVSKEAYLWYWTIPGDALASLVKASADTERLGSYFCKLGLEEDLDFTLPGPTRPPSSR